MNILDLSASTRALIAVVIAFVPAVVAYWRGRQIARFVDDPALPERLFTDSRVTSGCLTFTVAALLALTGRAAIWAIPLTVLAYYAAALPLRRVLYNETWSITVYLSFVIRFFIAFWSFWLLVCAMPALALWAGERAQIVSLAAGGALLLLAARQTELSRWLIGTQPIADEAIRARFDRLVAAAGLPAPHFELVDLKGGSIANAFALPSLGRPAVVFTGPLLERLDPDEADAICAHELAHLEYYSPRRLRHRRLVTRSLVVGGALLVPLLFLVPTVAWWACAVWPAVVLITLGTLAQDRQKHETASDLRAVALTGNPEALVRALIKVHAIARVPRRWDADLERHASHPSLKRRIQDIRAAAGTPPAALGAAAAFESADGAARVIFGDESLEWMEGSSAAYRLCYDRLSDLRIAATRTGETSLLAADRTGHRLQMPLRVDDVPRLQAILDIVDTRVAAKPPAPTFLPVLLRAATLTVAIVSLNAGQLAVAMVIGLAIARPDAPLVGAAGVAAIAGAILAWRDPVAMYGSIPGPFEAGFVAVLLVGGTLLVWLAYTRRSDEVPPRVWKLVAVMAAAAIASWLPIVGIGIDAVGLHQAARGWCSMFVLPLAVAGAAMWSSRKWLRVAASAVAVVATVTASGLRSQAFLDRFGGDLFLIPTTNVQVRTLDRAVKEFTLPFGISRLHVSPAGRSIAAVTVRQPNRSTIYVGRGGETLTPIDADGALFIDDDRLLAWTVDGTRTDLRELLVAAPAAPRWQLRVEGLTAPAVSLDARSRTWRLVGRGGFSVVDTREGVIGSEQIKSYQWNVPQTHGSPLMPIALSGDRALALEPRLDLSSAVTDPLGAFMFVLASEPRWRSTIWSLGPEGASDLGTSRLELECHLLPLAGRGACQIFDASRTRFFTMDARARGITAVASLPGRFMVGEEPQGDWITGWYQSTLVAVRLTSADAIRVADPRGASAHMLAVSDRAAAGIWRQMPPVSGMRVEPIYAATGTSVVRIYPID